MSEDDPKELEKKSGSKPAWDEDEQMRQWKEEYEALKTQLSDLTPENDVLGELENLRRAQAPPDLEERRAEPRYAFDETREAKIYAHIGPKAFQIVNISVGGVAFYSDVVFEPGTNILLSALGMVALDVEVLNCELEETNPDFMEYQYLVRASFSPRVNGYLVYVLSREMYLRQLQGA
jgi:hypothetical protein